VNPADYFWAMVGWASISRGDYNTSGIKQYEIFMGGFYERGLCASIYYFIT